MSRHALDSALVVPGSAALFGVAVGALRPGLPHGAPRDLALRPLVPVLVLVAGAITAAAWFAPIGTWLVGPLVLAGALAAVAAISVPRAGFGRVEGSLGVALLLVVFAYGALTTFGPQLFPGRALVPTSLHAMAGLALGVATVGTISADPVATRLAATVTGVVAVMWLGASFAGASSIAAGPVVLALWLLAASVLGEAVRSLVPGARAWPGFSAFVVVAAAGAAWMVWPRAADPLAGGALVHWYQMGAAAALGPAVAALADRTEHRSWLSVSVALASLSAALLAGASGVALAGLAGLLCTPGARGSLAVGACTALALASGLTWAAGLGGVSVTDPFVLTGVVFGSAALVAVPAPAATSRARAVLAGAALFAPVAIALFLGSPAFVGVLVGAVLGALVSSVAVDPSPWLGVLRLIGLSAVVFAPLLSKVEGLVPLLLNL